ncbi:hypothetical protein GQ600_27744 [Phytophthora cactorum]|nr:hypothetical protein GQ600_27744 [Phytophthora cactorum]
MTMSVCLRCCRTSVKSRVTLSRFSEILTPSQQAAFQTCHMRRMARLFTDVLCIDATHGTNINRWAFC